MGFVVQLICNAIILAFLALTSLLAGAKVHIGELMFVTGFIQFFVAPIPMIWFLVGKQYIALMGIITCCVLTVSLGVTLCSKM